MGQSNVKSVKAMLENGELKAEWTSGKSDAQFDVKIRENGKETDDFVVSCKSFSWKCRPAFKYEVLVRLRGTDTYVSSDTICTAPSKVYEVNVKMEKSAMKGSWSKLSDQNVVYLLYVYKDGECIIKINNCPECNFLLDKEFVSPSSTYKWVVWAQSVDGNEYGETTSAEITVLMQCNETVAVLARFDSDKTLLENSIQSKKHEGFAKCNDVQDTTVYSEDNLGIKLGGGFFVEPSDGYIMNSTTIAREKSFIKTFSISEKNPQMQKKILTCFIIQKGQNMDHCPFTPNLGPPTPPAGPTTNHVNANMALVNSTSQSAAESGNHLSQETN